MIKILTILAVSLCASSAFAGDLKLPAMTLIGAQVADLTTTARAIHSGRGVESNRVMVGSDAKRVAVKAITTTGTLFLASKLEQHHPTAAKVFLYSVAASVGVVAAQNYARTR